MCVNLTGLLLGHSANPLMDRKRCRLHIPFYLQVPMSVCERISYAFEHTSQEARARSGSLHLLPPPLSFLILRENSFGFLLGGNSQATF